MKVSIIITNWNGKSFLKRCLDSIKKFTKMSHEIIVVDNGSADGSVEMIKKQYPKVRLIENTENLGAVVAANQEIVASKGEYIVHLDNDTYVTKGWLESFVKVAEDFPKAGLVGAKLVEPDGRVIHGGGSLSPHWTREVPEGKQFTKPVCVEWVSEAGMLIKPALIRKIGFFDEKFSPIYFEETDICVRARRAGFDVVYTPNTVIYHKDSGSTKKQKTTKFKEKFIFHLTHRNRIRFMLLDYPVSWLLIRIPREFGFFVKHSLRGMFFPLVRGYIDNIPDLPEILHKRFNRTEFVESAFVSLKKH